MRKTILLILFCIFAAVNISAQTTAFSHQGNLNDSGNPANGNFDFEFRLFDTASGGTQQGATAQRLNVAVANGIFTVSLDFGAAPLSGADRFLDISVRDASSSAFTALSPRQPVTSAPYAVRSLNAGTATNFSGSLAGDVTGTQSATAIAANAVTTAKIADSGVTDAKIAPSTITAPKIAFGQVVKNFNGLTDNVALAAGSNISITPSGNTLTIASTGGAGNAILNQTTQQAGANFNISGNGLINGTLGLGLTPSAATLAAANHGFNTPALFQWGSPVARSAGTVLGLTNDNPGTISFIEGANTITSSVFRIAGNGDILTNGKVGVGTFTPGHELQVNGTTLMGASGGVYGFSVSGASPGPYPSLGFNAFYNGSQYLAGVTGYGGLFQFQDGDGKFGFYSTNVSGPAGTAQTLIPRLTILPNGNVGIGTATPSFPLHVQSSGAAIRGESINGSGVNGFSNGGDAVSGQSFSGSGIYGLSSAVSLFAGGVRGENIASGGIGVIGEADIGNATGVFGLSTSSTGFGIYGRNLSGGYAGYFEGKMRVTGVIEKAGGGFKIDHPLDPENKYLVHSFVESPDMKNLYDGTVTTDANGDAEVTLPDWFSALNRDFRYQLTCIGTFAQAIIVEEIKDNRFIIKTSVPQVKVSWQVTGTRQDAWANKNRLPVEEAKPAVERGFYQNPDAFGKPPEKGLEWAFRPAQMKEEKERREKEAREQANKPAAPTTPR